MRMLVVNADDFGLSLGVNDGIIEAHAAGIVTSTSVWWWTAPPLRTRRGARASTRSCQSAFTSKTPTLSTSMIPSRQPSSSPGSFSASGG